MNTQRLLGTLGQKIWPRRRSRPAFALLGPILGILDEDIPRAPSLPGVISDAYEGPSEDEPEPPCRVWKAGRHWLERRVMSCG